MATRHRESAPDWKHVKVGKIFDSPTSASQASFSLLQSITRTFCSRCAGCFMLLFATMYLPPSCANTGFTVNSTSYNCSSNVICLGGAHVYTRYDNRSIEPGMLSLIQEAPPNAALTSGIVYYGSPVRLLDPSSNQTASFNTSFVIDNVWHHGLLAGGMAFVISADNSETGAYGRTFGFFDAAGTTDFKSIVVEFDTFENDNYPCYDISSNHVSFDFSNITTNATANSSDVQFGNPPSTFVRFYAWVEFSSETQILQVSVSQNNSKPSSPLLQYSVDLFDVVDEYMWVGFSCGASVGWSNYYIGDWSFQSYGIPSGNPPASPPPNSEPGSPPLNSSSAQATFTLNSTSYDCSSNIICLGGAHVYDGYDDSNMDFKLIQDGRLSLIQEDPVYAVTSSGIAYYNNPVKFLDLASNQSASFNTSFVIDVVNINGATANGMAFVMSANNNLTGQYGRTFGIFDAGGTTDFKSVVVEFDELQDTGWPCYDISSNHVSIDFSTVTTNVSADTTNIAELGIDDVTVYAWVEYSSESQTLQVRVSYDNSRPNSPLLEHTVDLFDVVDEYMWVGFSSGAFYSYSNYYIGHWTFESYWTSAVTPPLSPAPGGKKSNFGVAVGLSVGISALILAGIPVIVIFLHRRCPGTHWNVMSKSVDVKEDPAMIELEGMPVRYSYAQLSLATDSFSEESKLGQGGFGSVYRGVLGSSGVPVAVKKISSESTGDGEKEFMAEISIISQLRHRHLIQLLGWCKDVVRQKYLLVYELMPNRSLDKVLFPRAAEMERPCLSWQQRFNILTGTAAAVEYLHQCWKLQVIHRDIKCSNILLDDGWNAKLGDFGLARLVDHERTSAPTTLVAGTYGYMAPEVVASGRFTDKSDVFAFGAVVLEIACGQRASLPRADPDEADLVDWVWHNMSEGHLLRTVDKRLGNSFDPDLMEVILSIGLLCSHPDPLARPSMRQVVQVLAREVPLPSIPTSKPVFSSRFEVSRNNRAGNTLGNTGSTLTTKSK